MSNIVNTRSQWCSAPYLAGLYQYGSPFTLFSACVFPLPAEAEAKAKANLIGKLLPYKTNAFIQMIIPNFIQAINKYPLAINYLMFPLIRYHTDYEYRWPLLATYKSLNHVYDLLECESFLHSALCKRRKAGNLRSHLLTASHSNGKLRKISKANEQVFYFIWKGFLSFEVKSFLLAFTLLFIPPYFVNAIMISRGHTNSFPS